MKRSRIILLATAIIVIALPFTGLVLGWSVVVDCIKGAFP